MAQARANPRPIPRWHAQGAVLENCNCRLLCRCALSYKEPADEERCQGYLALHVERGRYGDIPLDGLNAVLLYDAPQIMLQGGWRVCALVDERGDDNQRAALEALCLGRAGGGLGVLSQFHGERLPSVAVAIRFEDHGRHKRMAVPELLAAELHAIRGVDDGAEVRLINSRNVVFGSDMVLARGTTRIATPLLTLETRGTHATYNRFDWSGP